MTKKTGPSSSSNSREKKIEQRHPFLVWFIMILGLLLVILGFYQLFQIAVVPANDEEREELNQQEARHAEEYVTVDLFFYNKEKDREIAEYLPGSPDAVLPLERKVPDSDDLIYEAITLLLEGELTEEEKEAGFLTEFPGPGFKLQDIQQKNGTLILTFEDPEYFSTGGSMRTGIMATQIRKTALQFDGVEEVHFKPETIFQP